MASLFSRRFILCARRASVATSCVTLLLSALASFGQTNWTWNGSVNSDWFNATNWTPLGVPGSNDTINFNGGTINLSLPMTIGGVFNWSGGTLGGNGLTIASNGVLNINGSGNVSFGGAVTNAGTVNWLNSNPQLDDATGQYPDAGPLVNLPGGVWNIQCDEILSGWYGSDGYPYNTNAYFLNEGLMRKSVSTGVTEIGQHGSYAIEFQNQGTVEADAGTISFEGGGSLEGNFSAMSGATINFAAGAFVSGALPILTGPGMIQLAGGTLTLLSNTVPNLELTEGVVELGAGFQGGTITNLTLSGAVLSGDYTVSGVLNCGKGVSGSLLVAGGGIVTWTNGTISGPLTVASNGVLNINGSGNVSFGGALTNAGTVNWLNSNPQLDDATGQYPDAGPLVNLPGGVWNIQCDEILSGWYNSDGYPDNTNAYFLNEGLVRKSASTGVTEIGQHGSYAIEFRNLGMVEADGGTISFESGGSLEGNFSAMSGATINLAAGTFVSGALPILTGPGTIQLTGGTLTLLSNTVANLELTGGVVELRAGFQGGTITNLTLSGATLSGDYTVSGVLNCGNGVSGSLLVAGGGTVTWTNGTISGPITVASDGVLNLASSANISFGGALTNAGTVNWLSGNPQLDNQQSQYPNAGPLVNLPGGVWNIQCDEDLSGWNNADGYPYNTNAYFLNQGLVRKSAGSGVTEIGYHGGYAVYFENQGTVEADAGTVSLEGGFAPDAGELLFGLQSLTNFGRINFQGNASLGGTVGAVWLNGYVPTTNNSFTVLTYGSHSGIFTNLDLPPAALWATNYSNTSFTLVVVDINKLAFTTQPPVRVLTNAIMAPVVVQIEHPLGDPVAAAGVPVTLSLKSGGGAVSGTLIRNTDATGKATFDDLSFDTVGFKMLHVSAPNLTAANSALFEVVPAFWLHWTTNGALVGLYGNNTLGITTIYVSTNFVSWLPIYTNPPTSSPIEYLDTGATNFPYRFYRAAEQ